MSTITIGVDLAKSLFSVCEMDAAGHVLGRRDLGREAFALWLAQRPAARWWRWRRAAVRITGHGAAWSTACNHA
jgi:hypothetical protein